MIDLEFLVIIFLHYFVSFHNSVIAIKYSNYNICDLKCIFCMKNNDNDLVSSCFEYVSNNVNSIYGNK